jgi:hypothetical protein
VIQYDYKHQAWMIEGVYQACDHPVMLQCICYGRIHAGEPAEHSEYIHPTLQEMRDNAHYNSEVRR